MKTPRIVLLAMFAVVVFGYMETAFADAHFTTVIGNNERQWMDSKSAEVPNFR